MELLVHVLWDKRSTHAGIVSCLSSRRRFLRDKPKQQRNETRSPKVRNYEDKKRETQHITVTESITGHQKLPPPRGEIFFTIICGDCDRTMALSRAFSYSQHRNPPIRRDLASYSSTCPHPLTTTNKLLYLQYNRNMSTEAESQDVEKV
jgi:hypothetical protein